MKFFQVLRAFVVTAVAASTFVFGDTSVSASSIVDSVNLAMDFLEADLSLPSDGAAENPPALKIEGSGFDRTNGSWTMVASRAVKIKVSNTQQRVVSMENLTVKPKEVSVEDLSGRSRTLQEIQDLVVEVPLEAARSRAIQYASIHIGEEEVEGLRRVSDGLVSRGSHLVYRFAWREPLDEHGVARGMKAVSVEIDPTSGEVLRFRHLVSRVDGDQPIVVEQTECRQIVESEFGHLDGFKIVQMVLVSLFFETDAKSVPAWAVGYDFVGPMGPRIGACYVDAMTGDVLK